MKIIKEYPRINKTPWVKARACLPLPDGSYRLYISTNRYWYSEIPRKWQRDCETVLEWIKAVRNYGGYIEA